MRQRLYNFFIWCAGADRDLLERCGRSEHIKQAGYGGLVLIPAILGACSMTYAVSTLTDNPWAYAGAGLVWAWVVFVFDRFIVSTFRKSESPRKDLLSILFFSRLIFAIGIGIIVSHPLVLLVFDESLQQELVKMKEEGINTVYAEYEGKINAVRGRDSLLNAEIESKVTERQCKERLLLFEMSGKDTTLVCGTTSGMRQYGPRAREIKEEIIYLNDEINELRGRNYDKIGLNGAEIAQLQQERETKLQQFNEKFSTNYLAREIALERLQKEPVGGRTVRLTMWFLIIFFVLVDILPVSFKAAGRPGEYDRLLTLEAEIQLTSSPGYERQREDRVRQALLDRLGEKRIREGQQEIDSWQGTDFAMLRNKVQGFLNAEAPYTYRADTPDPVSSNASLAQQGFIFARYLLFALVQSAMLWLLIRENSFVLLSIPVFLLLNYLVQFLLRALVPATLPKQNQA
ncbi:MAG: DUF4407 domain-containing protein [Lewinellaceae bacterium]|nr:DUF4407 domain-containing protein [Lewinellaceae bacterium]